MHLGRLLGVEAPDLGGEGKVLRGAVGVFQAQRDRRDQSADVAQFDDVDVVLGPQQCRVDAGLLQLLDQRLILLLVAGQHRGLVVAVVEVLQFREPVDPLRDGGVAFGAERLRQGVLLRLRLGLLDGGIARVELQPLHLVDRDVDMVRAVEPAAPEPVQVDPAGVLHRAEEVGGRRTLEHPAARIGLERVVEGLTSEHIFPQDVQRGRRLSVGVRSQVQDRLRIGHHRHPFRLAHVVGHRAIVPARLPLVLPFRLSERLHERVDALVHPGPLAFVAVDDHREVIVPDLVDDHADERVFRALGVGAVLLRPRPVEADHRVFHSADGAVDRPGDRVGVGEGEPVVDFDGVGDGVGRILVPERHAFLGVERHRHDRLAVDLRARDRHRVPDELARAGEGEVPDILRFEHPGLLALGATLLGGLGFVRRDDEHRLARLLRGRGQTFPLGGREHLGFVPQRARGGDHVIVRRRQRDLVVAELEREFPRAEELLVHPARVVRVGGQPREPLGDGVDAVPVLLEVFVARAGHDAFCVIDRVGPADLEHEVGARLERLGQIQAQHRLHHRVGQPASLAVGQPRDLQLTVIAFVGQQPVECPVAELLQVDPPFRVRGQT